MAASIKNFRKPERPQFRFQNKEGTELLWACTDRAKQVAELVKKNKQNFTKKLTRDEAEKEARERVVCASGDPTNKEWVLSMTNLQFGKYRGKNFLWLLANDVGWTTMLLADHGKARGKGCRQNDPQWDNKEALFRYAQYFPVLLNAIKDRQISNTAKALPCSGDPQGHCLVGFGQHKMLSCSDLYNSPKDEHKKYVQSIRNVSVTHPGGQLDKLKQYVLLRDGQQAEQSEDELLVQIADRLEEHALHSASAAVPVRNEASTPEVSTGPKKTIFLPKTWQESLPKFQQEWMNKCLYTMNATTGKAELVSNLKMWWYPPEPNQCPSSPPSSPDSFFLLPFFLWVPQRLWKVKLLCTKECITEQANTGSKVVHLTQAGLYKTLRKVLDLNSWYYMGSEYLECKFCKKKFTSWSQHILNQLDMGRRSCFPALLTYRYSCDMKVVQLLRGRTIGNSSTRMQGAVSEQHCEQHMRKALQFLQTREAFEGQYFKSFFNLKPLKPIPPMPPVPKAPWFLAVYIRDVLGRIEETKAKLTSTFGKILKMDSTKKITKKLAGKAKATASWCTNVGNEFGQVLVSVLTDSEGEGLDEMAKGLMQRYEHFHVEPPRVLYVDRDCCTSRVAQQFGNFSQLVIRLDAWHYMRRFAIACCTESHALYGTFMSQLSCCIFEWDPQDVERLQRAKKAELLHSGKWRASNEDVGLHVGKKELARHCKRQTRGVEKTAELIENLINRLFI